MRGEPSRWEFFRRHERAFAAGYLALVVLLLAGFALPPVRSRILGGVQGAVDSWSNQWTRRLEMGEAMVRAGQYDAAVTHLERLDRDFPARDVRHGRDKERERLLVALGRAYTELDRKARAIETYQRLVAFDPLNYRNHYALGVAANKLLAGWAPATEARDAFVQVLTIHPNHLPSVRGAMSYYAARGEFAQVTPLYQQYLDAYLLQPITVSLGESSVTVHLPVDGAWHDVDVPLERPAGWRGPLSLASAGYSLGLARAGVLGPLRAGTAGTAGETALDLASIRGNRMTRVDQSWRAEGDSSRLELDVPLQPRGIALVRLRLRLFKPLDPTTWSMAVTAFRNQLDYAGLAAASARSLPMVDELTADSVLARAEWSYEGLGVGADDSRY